MAMQDQLSPAPGEHVAQRGAVPQRLAPAHRMPTRRMVQQHDAEASVLRPVSSSMRSSSRQLPFAKAAGGQERRRGPRRRQTDQGHVAPNAQRRKHLVAFRVFAGVVAAHVGRPLRKRVLPRLADVGIVIAGNDRDSLRRSQPIEPGRGLPELVRQPEMREVAGDGDVVEALAGRDRRAARRARRFDARGDADTARKGSRGSACRGARAREFRRATKDADRTDARARNRRRMTRPKARQCGRSRRS